MNQPYRPISCDFHSELELLALRRIACTIIFQENQALQTVESPILDLYTRSGEEFLLLSDGKEIRLDRLVSVNGMELEKILLSH